MFISFWWMKFTPFVPISYASDQNSGQSCPQNRVINVQVCRRVQLAKAICQIDAKPKFGAGPESSRSCVLDLGDMNVHMVQPALPSIAKQLLSAEGSRNHSCLLSIPLGPKMLLPLTYVHASGASEIVYGPFMGSTRVTGLFWLLQQTIQRRDASCKQCPTGKLVYWHPL